MIQETSREAYASILPVSAKMAQDVLNQLAQNPDGITSQAIGDNIGREHHSVSGTMRGLVLDGHAKASGRFGQTRSGRKAILWVAA
ncbi:hypothetical protein [Mesorhizobium sp. M1252]|uniref:hypothetical protein n=1 Tax=Mesorhizobium sp. M1252 TaxID=2957073 RepID=UPI003335F11B